MTKISVNEYLENQILLEAYYVPYLSKIDLVNAVLNGLNESIGYIDQASLYRISTQVFLEACTNLDLSIVDKDGLDGFDQLCREGELHNLINIVSAEIDMFNMILDFKLKELR